MSAGFKKRIFGLDIMRCLAILFVLFSHTAYMLPISRPASHASLMIFGVSGVEIFFVLSGYLIGKILLELFAERSIDNQAIRYFWIRRWFRTLPAYYLALLLYAGQRYYNTHELVFTEPYNLLYFVFLQNFFSTIPDFFIPSWSLGVEEWFYLLLPLWMYIFSRVIKRRSFALPAILTWIILFILLRIYVVYEYNPEWDFGVRFITPLRLDSLMIGVLLAYLHLHYKDQWNKWAVLSFVIGLAAIGACVLWLYFDVVMVGESQFLTKTLFFTIFSAAIACCLPFLASIQHARSRIIGAVVRHISLVSYSLYLMHVLAISLYLAVIHKFSLPNTTVFKFFGAWIASILLATLMYRFYEKPATGLREKFKLK